MSDSSQDVEVHGSDDEYSSDNSELTIETNQRAFKIQKTGIIRRVSPGRDLGPPQVHVSRLPPEILTTVFANLSNSDLCRAACVCTEWRDIAYNPSLWRDTDVYLTKMPINSELLFRSLSRRGIRYLHTSNATVLRMATKHMTTITCMSLGSYFIAAHNLCGYLLKQMPNLTQLNLCDFRHMTDCTIEVITQHLKKLVKFYLNSCEKLTDVSLLHIANGLPALKQLRLDDCELLSDVGIGYLCGRGCQHPENRPALEFLCLVVQEPSTITELSLLYLSEGQASLVELDLSVPTPSLDDGIIHLAKMNKLTKMVQYNTCISATSLACLFMGGSKITQLNLCYCLNLTYSGLEHAGRMTNLLNLTLYGCPISDAGLKLLVKFGSKISFLDLRKCPNLTDKAMKHVAKLKDLRKLSLSFTKVGDEGLGFLVAAGPCHLAILECSDMVTDVGLRHMAKLTNLHQLKLYGCNITCEGLFDFVNCKADTMTHLDLFNWGSLSRLINQTLLHMAQRLFRLEVLKLATRHVNYEGKAEAARNLPRLYQLNVDCKNIIDQVRKIW